MHQFPEIEEVNMFKDDNMVMHFDKPNGRRAGAEGNSECVDSRERGGGDRHSPVEED